MELQTIEILQTQLNNELRNSQVYLGLAGAFEVMNLSGFAAFMFKNSDEERSHAHKFFDFLSDIGAQPRIDAQEDAHLELPSSDLGANALTLFNVAYQAEQQNLVALNIVDATDDAATEAFLVPILNEQIASIKEFAEWLTKLQLAQGNGAALLELDEKAQEAANAN